MIRNETVHFRTQPTPEGMPDWAEEVHKIDSKNPRCPYDGTQLHVMGKTVFCDSRVIDHHKHNAAKEVEKA